VSSIRPEAQAIIDRLKAVDQEKPYTLDAARIERAFADHLKALAQPCRPVQFIGGLGAARDAVWSASWDAARDAAWDAARGAARDAARDAAWGAAWGAAIANSLYDHPQYHSFRAVWMPFIDACEAGLFVYWITQAEVIAVPRPLFRFRGEHLHGDGMPAIAYPNGERHYFWRGVRIPEEWGRVHSEHWRPEWLLAAKNAEHRRVLIQGLGYHRIMAALPNTLIHSQDGMELREITKAVDVEPIRLLKVVCPSTGFAHVLRVPTGVDTCEEARRTTFPWPDVEIMKET